MLFLLAVAGCSDGEDPQPVTVIAHPQAFPVPHIVFQDQTGATVPATNAGTSTASASADLPDGGMVIVYAWYCGFENYCGASAWAVRGVRPGDTVTVRERADTTGPHILVEPGPVETIMDCHGSWSVPSGLPLLPYRVQEDISLLVLGSYPQTFPSLPPHNELADPSLHWDAVRCQ